MAYLDVIKEENEQIRERYELAMERIEQILYEHENVEEQYRHFFKKTASFIMLVRDVVTNMESGEWELIPLDEWKQINYDLYQDLMPKEKVDKDYFEGYGNSYANPSYAKEALGDVYSKYLCFLYTELRGCVAYAFEQRLFDITIALELFIEIFNLLECEDENTAYEIKQAIYYYVSDYCDITMPKRVREMLDPSMSFATEIIMESDLEDLRYLYRYGEYISENEIKIATYLNSLPQKQIDAMAATYTEGFRKGFEAARIDLTKKKTVNIRYCIGFERMVRAAILQFREMGLEPTIYRAAVSSIHKKQHLKIGYFGTSVNRQYDYDHRFDQAIYLDKPLGERKLVNVRLGYEAMEELA